MRRILAACALAGCTWVLTVNAQQPVTFDVSLFRELKWRNIGPMRGGRTKAATGIASEPNVFLVGAVNGGVWKTTDYGRTWAPIFDDQGTGSIGAIAVAPSDPNIIYVGSGEGLQRPDLSTGDGLYKSTDGGRTWLHLGLDRGQQIPQIVVDPRDPNRLFIAVLGHPYGPNPERGIFRSLDGGRTLQRVLYKDDDTGGVDVVIDPANASTVYAVLWQARLGPWENGVFSGPGSGVFKSTDGGTTWRSIVSGLPTFAGDGLGRIGITVAPSTPERLYATVEAQTHGGLYRSDNGGESWSLVNGDERVTSRGSDFAEVKVDPKNPDIVYTASIVAWKSTDGGRTFTGWRGAPGGDDYHRLWINPNNRDVILLAGDQGAIVTVNGGQTWAEISPDLSRETWEVPDTVGVYRGTEAAKPTRRGVIYTVAPSYVDSNVIWAGTDDGLIHVTRDAAKTWTDVTPLDLKPWSKVSLLEASHFDINAAYAAVNTIRLDDLRPHLYRTRDGGRSWTQITRGLPDGFIVNAVREDPLRRGLLFAGTEQGVSVSFDDGESWQTLRLNMPATSIRDLIIKDEDLIVATHGRGFWILDDISPLRQITSDLARAAGFIFRPPTAWRFRWNKNTDTPLPPDEPAMPNPPDGVTISYLVGAGSSGPVTLEILETSTGELLRKYSSDDPADAPVPAANVPVYWFRPAPRLQTTPGLHRFVWDVRYAPPAVDRFDYPIAAVARNTPKTPQGMWALPGTYQVRLTVGGRTYRQAVVVRMDPRVKTSIADLTVQFKLSKQLMDAMRRVSEARADIKTRSASVTPGQSSRWSAVAAALEAAHVPLSDIFQVIQDADAKPTAANEAVVAQAIARVDAALAGYEALRGSGEFRIW